MKELVILGGGPAGMAAAIYAGRYRRDAVLLTEELGGQLALITQLDNYPGFPEGVSGPVLAGLMQQQAERFGMEFRFGRARSVDFSRRPLALSTDSGDIETQALIIATGTAPRKLQVPGEDKFLGQGISYCATCDGFFFRGKEVVVVGGNNYAVEEALALTRFATRVTMVPEREGLWAVPELQERVAQHPQVEVVPNAEVIEVLGDDSVAGLRVRDRATGAERDIPTQGLFVYRGRTPNTGFLGGQLELDERGYIVADEFGVTAVPGVFVAGSVRRGTESQVATCVGSGVVAALSAERFLAG
ncbi:MAG: NAD(P)/FAD-dependent oxidoreductase [Anaerolineae bacterium]|jgi:thioredoxin reductase (NADPH)